MKLTFNQPAFIPWGGFFARLIHSESMVLLDETVLARGFTYVNRNRIKGPRGEVWLTVPLKRKGRGVQRIRELEIYEKEKWRKKFLLTLRHYYGKSLYFRAIEAEIMTVLDAPDPNFCPMAVALLTIIKSGLEIQPSTILQSETGVTGRGTGLLVSLAKELGAEEVILPYFSDKAVDYRAFEKERIHVRLVRYDPPHYPQFWGDFLKNLSALDLLFCCGKEGRAVIEKGAHLCEIH